MQASPGAEALAEVAGNIAHDFNNLLMVMRGHAELLALRLGSESPLYASAQEVLAAADKATELVAQLRTIKGPATNSCEPARLAGDECSTPEGSASPWTAKILVVDDEGPLREVTSRFLRMEGYDVTDVGSGREAVELLRATDSPFDLLITDVVMPEMSGKQVAEAVASLSPTTRIVLASGYTQGTPDPAGLSTDLPLLQKPFSRAQLAELVRGVLASAPRPAEGDGGSLQSPSLEPRFTAQSQRP